MSKILFAVVAAVCAFQVLTASPLLEIADFKDLEMEDKMAPIHELMFDTKFLNASKILEAIENILSTVQAKAEEITAKLEAAVKNALDKIEQAAINAADRWNATIDEWVQRASEAGVNIVDCIENNGFTELPELANELREEAKECVSGEIDKAKQAVQDVKNLVTVARKLVNDTRNVIETCADKDTFIQNGLCLVQNTPYLGIRAARLTLDSVALSARAAARIAAVAPMASLCASKVAASKGADASKIVDATTACIREKLGNNNNNTLYY